MRLSERDTDGARQKSWGEIRQASPPLFFSLLLLLPPLERGFEGRRQNLLLPPFSPSLKFATDPVTPPPPPPRSVPSFFFAASPPIFYELGGRPAESWLLCLSLYTTTSPRRTHAAGTARGPALAEREARLSDSLTAR